MSILALATDYYSSSSSSDSGPLWLLALGPAGAGGVYWALWAYYRNTGKSHDFEHETLIKAQPVKGEDQRVDTVRGTRRSSIDGDNSSTPRERVRRLS
ncbi:hypothetical protein [Nocardioides sp.]|uniref:hypothetical protein n=1 Tax=Nocardioides sp. TaxID=35761 RepID=UPI00261BAEEE|nr:hypothetical protein [Nocardioides sp.]